MHLYLSIRHILIKKGFLDKVKPILQDYFSILLVIIILNENKKLEPVRRLLYYINKIKNIQNTIPIPVFFNNLLLVIPIQKN